MTAYIVIYLFTEIFYFYILSIVYEVFLGQSKTKQWQRLVFFLTFFLVADGSYLLWNNVCLNVGINLLFLLLLSLQYQASYRKRIITTLSIYIVMVLARVLVQFFIGRAVPESSRIKSTYEEILDPVLFKIILFFAAITLCNAKKSWQEKYVPLSQWFATFLVPVGSLYLLVVMVDSLYDDKMRLAVSLILILMLNMLVFFLYNRIGEYYSRQMDMELIRREAVYYDYQFEGIKKYVDEVNCFRHDFKNHLIVLETLMEGEEEKARKYLEKLNGKLSAKELYAKTGNKVIDSIINYQFSRARENQIEIEVKLAVPTKLSIDESDMVAVLGNLLQNAFNGTMQRDNQRKIIVEIQYVKDVLQISIKNTYSGVLKIKNNFLKSTSPGKNHGFGLSNAERGVRRYHGTMEFQYDNTWFEVKAILYPMLMEKEML